MIQPQPAGTPTGAFKILTLVARHVGGVAVFWENLGRQFPTIEVVYFTPDRTTFFDVITRTLHVNAYDPLGHVYAVLARYVNPDDYHLLVANERFELEFFLWSRTRHPVAFIVHTNHEHSYSVAFRHTGAVNQFFCVSETAEAYLGARGVARVRSFQYSTFIDTPAAAEKRNRVLYVGRLEPDKNIAETLELFRLFKTRGYEVCVIGVGSMEAQVRAALEPHEVRIGIPRSEVLREMAGARFLCLNSYVEGLPIIYAEAMHFRLGVICNYLDKSGHRLLGDNHLLHSTPETLLGRMATFTFTPPPAPLRVNNCELNNIFIAQLREVPAPTQPRPVFRPGGLLDNLGWLPPALIRTFRSWRMQRRHAD